jgi:DNA polymerase-3 subunit beta
VTRSPPPWPRSRSPPGRDDTLPVLTGVRLEIEGSTITMAATDRYRLAVRELAWSPEQTGLEAIALVPARTLADTAKALANADKVTVALATPGAGEGLVGFEGSGRRTTSRLLDGEFPKYKSLLPAESATVATVSTAGLVESVRRVALVAERNTPIRLSFSAGEVTLEAGSGDEAQASESLDATLDGDDISIAFNPAYLLDGLGALGAEHAELRFTAPTRPAVLAGKDSARRRPATPTATCSCRCACPAETPLASVAPLGAGSGPVGLRVERAAAWTSDSSGSARWAATCASACVAPATPSWGTTATRPE